MQRSIFSKLQFFTLVYLLLSMSAFAQFNSIVAQDGTGNYATVQAAIDAAPTSRTTPYIIYIKNGKYREKINIPATKPFIQLVGEDVGKVILTYDDYASKMTSCYNTVGTQNSASFTINAIDFAAFNITFQNSYGEGSQAVAVLVNADRAVFYNCRFLGNQDTLYLKGGGTPRNYFKNCYIDGNVDFIFGSSVAIFDSCVVYAKSRSTAGSSYITAPNTPFGQSYGFIFRDCEFPNNTGATLYYLSRPWPSPSPSGTQQKVVLLSCLLSSHINAAGWSIWDANTITSNLYNAEYNSRYFNRLPVDVSQRVAWSYQITQADSATYTFSNVFSTWNPLLVIAGVAAAADSSLAVSNFNATKLSNSTKFNWNASWLTSDVEYQLYKSTDNINFNLLTSINVANDSVINYSFTDNNTPPAGSKYYYYLVASKTGYQTHVSDTVIISSAADFQVNASPALYLCGFSQTLGSPSAAQTYTLSGSNLVGDIIITPPSNFEVSANNSTWYTSSQSLHLIPSAGTVALSTIYVRLNASAVGNYSGNVLNVSAGDTDVNVQVAGVTYPVATSFPLQIWPMTTNNIDSAGARSIAVTPSTSLINSTTNNLYTSDGTQPSANPIPAYSAQYGQAIGANSSGNAWTNVGGTLNRRYFQQFTVTAASGYSIKVDSISFFSDFYLSNSNTKMAVVYSKNGFTSPGDSSEMNNGIGPNGTVLTLTTSGTFSKSFPLLRNDAGPVNRYSISLNGNTGVSLNEGETITIRLYWACGSSSTPRFAFLKNVTVLGVVTSPLPLNVLSFKGHAKEYSNQLNWNTESELNMNSYIIERSNDGLHFNPIATIASKNNTFTNEYTYDDIELGTYENFFYRLKMKENNGDVTYSKVISIVRKNNATFQLFPNPSSDVLQIQHEAASDQAYCSIKTITGKKIKTIQVLKGTKVTSINVANLPTGEYVLVYVNNHTTKSLTFIKK